MSVDLLLDPYCVLAERPRWDVDVGARIDVFDYDGEITNRRSSAARPTARSTVSSRSGGERHRLLLLRGPLVVTGDGKLFAGDVGVGGAPAQPFRSAAPSDAEPTSAR